MSEGTERTTERMLITKLSLTSDGTVELFGRGHRFRDLLLFDASDLALVGIDYEDLQVGVEVPCRFWAVYSLSEKLNQAKNPYKDVVTLQRIEPPAESASTYSLDTDAIVEELRAIRSLLEQLLFEGVPDHALRRDPARPKTVAAQPEVAKPPAKPVEAPSGSEDLSGIPDHELRRMFFAKAGPTIKAGQIGAQRVNELAALAKDEGWAMAYGWLIAEIGGAS